MRKATKKKHFVYDNAISFQANDLIIAIDDFLTRLKNSETVKIEDKAKILSSYKTLLVNISNNFKTISNQTNVKFEEPLSIKVI